MATVLLIDDDPAVRRMVGRMLRSAGHDVVEAADGRAGLAALQARSPDIVVTDVMMPDTEGIETIRRIRETSELPVVAMSGALKSGDQDVLLDAKLLGADFAIAKPFRREELLAAINNLLGQQ